MAVRGVIRRTAKTLHLPSARRQSISSDDPFHTRRPFTDTGPFDAIATATGTNESACLCFANLVLTGWQLWKLSVTQIRHVNSETRISRSLNFESFDACDTIPEVVACVFTVRL